MCNHGVFLGFRAGPVLHGFYLPGPRFDMGHSPRAIRWPAFVVLMDVDRRWTGRL